MGIFGKFQSGVNKLLGRGKEATVFPSHKQRAEESAAVHAQGQSGRRQKLLEERVKSGESEKVYKNRKPVNPLSVGVGPILDSVTIEAFLDGHEFSRFSSSNVWALCYDRKASALHVQYMAGKGKNKSGPGTWYRYDIVDIGLAKIAYNFASKGVFSWSYLRLRGTKDQNRKPTTKNSPPPGYLPLGRKRSNILQTP